MHFAGSGRFVYIAQWVAAVVLPLILVVGRSAIVGGGGWIAIFGILFSPILIAIFLLPPILTWFDPESRGARRTRIAYDVVTFVLWATIVIAAFSADGGDSSEPMNSVLTTWTGGRVDADASASVFLTAIRLGAVAYVTLIALAIAGIVRAPRPSPASTRVGMSMRQSSVRGTIRALWGSTHPGPTLVVSALALALGIAVGLEPWRLVLLTLSVFCGQLSIGLSNDAIDAPRDRAVSRTDKPIARGDVTERTAWVAAGGSLVVALGVSAVFGFGMLAAHAIFLASAWAYNLWLKSTPFSIVPFLVSFGIFPSLVTLAAAEPRVAQPWGWIAGAVLGASVHLTNVLPDLDDDRRTGVRGLPHRLGPRVSAVIAAAGIVVGAVAVLLGAAGGDVAAVSLVSWLFFGAVVVVAALTAVLALVRPPSRALFRLVMLAALLLAAQLIATGGAVAA